MPITTTRRTVAAIVAAAAAFVLPALPATPAHAAWLGKRGVIVFTGHTTNDPKSSVWFVNSDGTGAVEMTPNDHRNDFDATFSPEGGPHVVYTGRPMGGGDGDLFVIDRYPPGGGLPKPDPITDDLEGDAEHPAFSPSGGKIVFDLTQDGKATRIWTTNLIGTKKAPLTCCRSHSGYPLDQPIDGRNPSWSPDSTTIAYVAPDPSNPRTPGIWLASYDGRTPPVFLTDGDLPNWSPLQDKIVYVLGSNLMVANPNPQNPDPEAVTRESGNVSDTHPAWSPDSDHTGGWAQNPGTVLFERSGRIYLVGAGPVSGPKQPHAVTSTRFVASNADWQPKCSNNKPSGGTHVIRGTDGPDLLCGGPGNDTIYGLAGTTGSSRATATTWCPRGRATTSCWAAWGPRATSSTAGPATTTSRARWATTASPTTAPTPGTTSSAPGRATTRSWPGTTPSGTTRSTAGTGSTRAWSTTPTSGT